MEVNPPIASENDVAIGLKTGTPRKSPNNTSQMDPGDFVPPTATQNPHDNLSVIIVPTKASAGGRCFGCRTCLWRIRFCVARPFQPDFHWRDVIVRNFTYFRIHFLYFMILSLIGGGFIYAIENNIGSQRISYTDALYTATSACCVTGLIVVDTAALHTGSHIVILFLMILGSNVLMSAVPVLLRLRYFVLQAGSKYDDEATRQKVLSDHVEYRALKWVATIALIYFFGAQSLVFILWGLYFSFSKAAVSLPLNAWWLSLFTCVSSFNNAGFTLSADNMIGFASDYVVLLPSAVLILMGNIAYPLLFRAIVHTLHKGWHKDAALKFLLDTPRKCFTHMFPSLNSRILLVAVLTLTLSQFILFMALDYNLPLLDDYSGHVRSLIAIYQSISTRTAGFNVVDISQVSPAMQVVFALMMYVAAYPFLLTVRKSSEAVQKPKDRQGSFAETNSEMSFYGSIGRLTVSPFGTLGKKEGGSFRHAGASFRSGDTGSLKPSPSPVLGPVGSIRKLGGGSISRMDSYFERELGSLESTIHATNVREQAKSVASRDLLWLFIGLLVICIAENDRLREDPNPRSFNVFTFLFEISSAYGTVGLSLGYPGTATSLSGELTVVSKLVIIFIMLCGRHRGLPRNVDSAVYLPSILNAKPRTEDETAPSLAGAMVAAATAVVRRQRTFASLRNLFAGLPEQKTEELVLDRTRVEQGAELAIVPDEQFLAEIATPPLQKIRSRAAQSFGAPPSASRSLPFHEVERPAIELTVQSPKPPVVAIVYEGSKSESLDSPVFPVE